jgi:hypothetical protein
MGSTHIPELTGDSNIDIYLERLEQFFVCRETANTAKVATLITVIGEDSYRVLRSLCQPDLPASKDYDTLVQLLKQHYAPQQSELAARFRFQRRVQQPDESLASFIAGLRAAAADCNFGKTLDERLRDQLVFGVRSDAFRSKLLEEAQPTYTSLVAALRRLDLAEHTSAEMSTSSTGSVCYIRSHDDKCAGCGGSHSRQRCPLRNAKCHNCGRIGHIEKVCRAGKINAVQVEEKEDFECAEYPSPMY